MATYKQIQADVKADAGFTPKTCWIADVKNRHGLISRPAPNRLSEQRAYPCPEDKRPAIEAAMRSYGMIK